MHPRFRAAIITFFGFYYQHPDVPLLLSSSCVICFRLQSLLLSISHSPILVGDKWVRTDSRCKGGLPAELYLITVLLCGNLTEPDFYAYQRAQWFQKIH